MGDNIIQLCLNNRRVGNMSSWSSEKQSQKRASSSGGKANSGMTKRANLYQRKSRQFDFTAVDEKLLLEAVVACMTSGAAIMFAYSAAQNVMSVRTFFDDEKYVGYFTDGDAFNIGLEETRDFFSETASSSGNSNAGDKSTS